VITFHSGFPPKGFKPDFESFLFNTRTHRQLQKKSGWKEYHLLNHSNKILASVFFNLQGAVASTPLKAPFGSYQVSEKIKPKDLFQFVKTVEKELLSEGVQQIDCIGPPELYSPTQSLITSTLVSLQYQIIEAAPGCCIAVNEFSLADKMGSDKKAKLKLAVKENLTYQEIPSRRLNTVYRFIESCRKERDQTLSMTLAQLKKIVHALPHVFHLAGVYSENRLAAASICIRINGKILYTFYSGHASRYNKLSPLVFLLSQLYDWCSMNNMKLLDMGTSSLDGKPNFPLLDFKLRVGGILTPKFRFQKALQ
jgi:hypothetical protein